jgi:signal transduction histidine kinase/HPt (histidine-containing phosphotransfer) domain-containing protein
VADSLKKNSILIVDDDAANLMQLIHILQPEYTVFTAKNGSAALEIAAKSVPDLILLDIVMPEMSGFEVLSELKKSDKTNEIPVIFITGINDSDNESEGLSLGAVDYIRKPFYDMVVKLRVRHQIQIINLKQNLESVAEAAEAANRTKSSFLASMSHEIRTPMNAVIGMLELLTHEPLNSRQMSYVKDINQSATSLLTIINDILDMSKIESGKMELVPVDYDFLALLDNIHSMFTYVSEEKGLKFNFEADSKVPRYLFGDDIRLRQVLINICGNAVKFTEKGYVQLNVINSGDTLTFEVSDTGAGIKNEDIGRLFNAFQQTDSTKNRGIIGTGLGLAICKSFIEMKGGTITVESEYGKGSTFIITIPLIKGDGEKAKTAATPKGRKLSAPKAKVLVVDDNEFNLKVAVGLLNLSGISAKTASSGLIALEMVQQADFDIVFMDHMMPEMDGVETTTAIRALGGEFNTDSNQRLESRMPQSANCGRCRSSAIPVSEQTKFVQKQFKQPIIIALTANAVHGVKDFFLANGFNDFVSKPIDVRELVSVLERWLPEGILENITAAPDAPDSGEPGFLDMLGGIEDINVNIGLNSAAGSECLYYEAVEMCCKQLPAECTKMSSSLSGGDINGFAISVHAMKSILATIGAMDLSDAAFKLETTAKAGDSAVCEELFPSFRDDLTELHRQLSVIFPAKTATVKTPGDFEVLRKGVEAALIAVKDFDDDAGVAAIEPLLVYDFGEDINALLEEAATEFGEFECKKAGEALGKIVLPLM